MAFILQSWVVQPVQFALFPETDFTLANIISIPFGVGLMIVLMMGYKGVPVVILGKSVLESTFMDVAPLSALIHGLHDGVALLLALMATAYMLRRDLKQGLLMQSVCASTLIRQAFFMSMRYLMSHIVGGLFIFASLYLLRFRLSRWITVKDA